MRACFLAVLLSCAALTTAGPRPAVAAPGPTQAMLAEALNKQGIKLMMDGKYGEASSKFREAVARVPDPRYFFNLATSLFQEGKFGEALTACNAVFKNDPSPDLKAKAEKLAARIKEEARNQDIKLAPP